MYEKNINFNNFSLVLSGGGALGIAHLGVIEDLEKNNLIPKELIGTSMGGIICACIAIGLKEKDIFKLFKEFSSLTNWLKFSLKGNSVINSSKLETIFDEIFKNKKMCETIFPLKLIATNFKDGSLKVFDSKDDILIKDAVMATTAIPGIFDEKIIKDDIYVDGFLCENLGVQHARYDDVLAVNVYGKDSFEEALPNNLLKTQNILNMFEKSFKILIHNQSKMQLDNSSKKIYLIEPVTKAFHSYQFNKYKELKALGKGLLQIKD